MTELDQSLRRLIAEARRMAKRAEKQELPPERGSSLMSIGFCGKSSLSDLTLADIRRIAAAFPTGDGAESEAVTDAVVSEIYEAEKGGMLSYDGEIPF